MQNIRPNACFCENNSIFPYCDCIEDCTLTFSHASIITSSSERVHYFVQANILEALEHLPIDFRTSRLPTPPDCNKLFKDENDNMVPRKGRTSLDLCSTEALRTKPTTVPALCIPTWQLTQDQLLSNLPRCPVTSQTCFGMDCYDYSLENNEQIISNEAMHTQIVENQIQKLQLKPTTNFSKELAKFDRNYYEISAESERSSHANEGLIYTCKYENCLKIFKRAQNIVVHLRMHLGIKQYECKKCHKRYVQKGNLDKHYKQHNYPRLRDRKVLNCDTCGDKFTEKYNLKSHQKRKHHTDI